MKNNRNLSVEAFRCLLMYLIVLGHTLSFWQHARDLNWRDLGYLVCAMFGMIAWHVDGFIGISGWYGIKFSFRKFIYLMAIIAFYGFLGALLQYVFKVNTFPVSWLWRRGGWFGAAYLVLMLSAPLLNAGVKSLVGKSTKSLFVAWLMMTFAFICSWMPAHFFTGINALGFGHQTFLMMAFVYLTARCARHFFTRPVPLRWLVIVVVSYLAIILMISWCSMQRIPFNWFLGVLTLNHSPLVYIVAIAMLMIFVWHVRIPAKIGRVVQFISPSMFGVYLFHQTIIRWDGTSDVLDRALVEKVMGESLWGGILIVSIACFAVSVIVDLCRRLMAAIVRPRFDVVISRIDDWFGSKIDQCVEV